MKKFRKSIAINTIKRCAALYIIRVVCNHYNLEPQMVFSKTVRPKYLEARQTIIYLLSQLSYSVREVEFITGVCYTSVSRHKNRVINIISVDKDYKSVIEVLHFSITQNDLLSSTLCNTNEVDRETEEILPGIPD